MNCSGEEQERLLSLLEQEGAKKKNTNRLPKDERNGEYLRMCLFVDGLFSGVAFWVTATLTLHSKRCLHYSGLLPENRSQAASNSETETNPTGECHLLKVLSYISIYQKDVKIYTWWEFMYVL